MADLGKLERTDPTREVGGVWVRYKADIEFRIARLNNPKHRSAMQRLLEQPEYQARGRAGGQMAADAMRDVTLQSAAEAILTDWRNVAVDGQDLTYTTETALRVLTEFGDVREFILNYARALEPYLLAQDEVGEKNSVPSSDGAGGRPQPSTEIQSNGSPS